MVEAYKNEKVVVRIVSHVDARAVERASFRGGPSGGLRCALLRTCSTPRLLACIPSGCFGSSRLHRDDPISGCGNKTEIVRGRQKWREGLLP